MIGPRIQTHHRLRIARLESKLTQRALAEYIGTNIRNIENWEQGRTHIPGYALTKLARICGVDPDWILDGGTSLIEFRDICPVCKQDTPIIGLDRTYAVHGDKAGNECPMGARRVAA